MLPPATRSFISNSAVQGRPSIRSPGWLQRTTRCEVNAQTPDRGHRCRPSQRPAAAFAGAGESFRYLPTGDTVQRGVRERARRLQNGRASCRARVCQYVEISCVAVRLKKITKKDTT